MNARPETTDLFAALAAALAAMLVRGVCTTLASRMSFLSSKAVKKTLREEIYGKLLRLGTGYREQVNTSEVVQVAVEGVDQLEDVFRGVSAAVFLRDARAADSLCRAEHGEPAVGGGCCSCASR